MPVPEDSLSGPAKEWVAGYYPAPLVPRSRMWPASNSVHTSTSPTTPYAEVLFVHQKCCELAEGAGTPESGASGNDKAVLSPRT